MDRKWKAFDREGTKAICGENQLGEQWKEIKRKSWKPWGLSVVWYLYNWGYKIKYKTNN